MNFFNLVGNIFSGIFDPLITHKPTPLPKNPKKIDLSEFELVFEDNFTSDKLDATKWHEHICFNRETGVRKGGKWSPSQAFIEDNMLHIRTEYKTDGEYGEGYYSEAIDTSELFEQKYGYFECRCKLPEAEGLWAAFWLHSMKVNTGTPGTEATEIDIFESPLYKRKKVRNSVVSNLHYNGYGIQGKSKRLGAFEAPDPYNQFNTYGLEWNENEYVFYINGVETSRSSFGGVAKEKEFMILSVEVDGVDGKPVFGWSGNVENNPKGTLPVDFVVDYVKVYQYKHLLDK